MVLIGVFISLILLNDVLLSNNIISYRNYQLQNNPEIDKTSLEADISQLKTEVLSLTDKYALISNRKIPTIGEIKNVCTRHKITIKRVEHLQNQSTDKNMYAFNFSGSHYNIVYFMNSLENEYIVNFTESIVKATDASGNTISLIVVLEVEK